MQFEWGKFSSFVYVPRPRRGEKFCALMGIGKLENWFFASIKGFFSFFGFSSYTTTTQQEKSKNVSPGKKKKVHD